MRKIIEFFTHKDKILRDNRWIFGSMLVGSIASLIASFVLSVEAVELAENPDAILSCSVNIVLNCATVGLHPSAYLFGFPNSFLGLMAEPVVITVAIAGLAGIKFPRKFMFAAQIGYTLGLIFALYLLATSYFVIGALCPWCLVVTLTTTLVWFAITRFNIRENNLYLPKKVQKSAYKFVDRDFDKLVMWSFIALVVVAIMIKYGEALFV
ncbi:vitamin K epoxide reductase family protein [Candidatus Nomurabacteria bacterium]|nr:vitamin K epoxide reductase family protein [Candidatus Nomurabacteria bacterium]